MAAVLLSVLAGAALALALSNRGALLKLTERVAVPVQASCSISQVVGHRYLGSGWVDLVDADDNQQS
uniref:Tail tubular protein B n=1 Tax=uncultured marine virus TaxID=186617 RepID=A0A0F7LCB2_9VIRU|nr:tail tubular protein B [uncultured marine virus]